MPVGRRLARRLRALRARLRPGALVLLYHRVARPGVDPFDLCVAPDRFAEQLELLRRTHRLATLSEIREATRAGRSVRGWVALTFDDGYRDNLTAALPILESTPASRRAPRPRLKPGEEGSSRRERPSALGPR